MQTIGNAKFYTFMKSISLIETFH